MDDRLDHRAGEPHRQRSDAERLDEPLHGVPVIVEQGEAHEACLSRNARRVLAREAAEQEVDRVSIAPALIERLPRPA